MIVGASAGAQDLWYRVYLDGKAAYDRGDYEVAEERFLASMKHPQAPPQRNRGPQVLLVSQQRGFMPEYYLALIYARRQQWVNVVQYAAVAEGYQGMTDALRGPLLEARTTAARELKGGGIGPDPNAIDALVAQARADADAGRFSEARSTSTRALSLGGSAASIGLLQGYIDTAEFRSLMRDGTSARDAGRYAEARTSATRAAALGVDASLREQAQQLNDSIQRHETFGAEMTTARQALAGGRWAEARASAERAEALGVNNAEARSLIADATSQETFAGHIASARQSLTAGQVAEAKSALTRAQAMNIASPLLTELAGAIESRETADQIRGLADQIDALVAKKSAAGLSPLVNKLSAIDPRHPAVTRAQAFTAASLANDAQRERFGLNEFFRGRYEAAAQALQQLAAAERPQAHLYLAYSKAALSLLEADDARRQELAAEARKALETVRRRVSPLSAANVRYVSPNILRLLDLTPQGSARGAQP